MLKKSKPPKLAEKLLEEFFRQVDCSHSVGDFEEVFQFLALERGLFHAKEWYWNQVLSSIPDPIKNTL